MLSRFEKFIIDITEIDLYWHRLASDVMKSFGLKGSYAIYFTKLHGHPGGLTSAELSAMCGKDKADVSRDISALERAGLVERVRAGANTYRAKITLTEQGKKYTDEITRKAELAVSCVGQSLSDSERDCFYRVLDSITENLRKLSETGLPDREQE